MLKWCAYCQHFLGEVPDFANFDITHGICADCRPKVRGMPQAELERARALRALLQRLYRAGRSDNFAAIGGLLDEAIAAGVRPIDYLMGLVAPALYRIGVEWETCAISVDDEHRFTAFCEAVLAQVSARTATVFGAATANQGRIAFLLMNAPGNVHTLGIRIVSLWLQQAGHPVRFVEPPRDAMALAAMVEQVRPAQVLLSVSMPDQLDSARDIAAALTALPDAIRPRLVVGGYAIKLGLVRDITGAELVTDIQALAA